MAKAMKMDHMHMHSKFHCIVAGLVLIALGVCVWIGKLDLIQLVAVLLILIGLHKLGWAFKGNCCK